MLLCLFLVACFVAVYVHLQRRGERLEKHIYQELVANRHFSTEALSISVTDVTGRKLIRPTIIAKQNGKTSIIVAVMHVLKLSADLVEVEPGLHAILN